MRRTPRAKRVSTFAPVACLLAGCSAGVTKTEPEPVGTQQDGLVVWSAANAGALAVHPCAQRDWATMTNTSPPAHITRVADYVTLNPASKSIDLLREPAPYYQSPTDPTKWLYAAFACSGGAMIGGALAPAGQVLGSSAYLDVLDSQGRPKVLNLGKAYTLTFDAQFQGGQPDANSLGHLFVKHFYAGTAESAGDGGRVSDRFFVDATKRTFQVAINAPFAASVADPTAVPAYHTIYVERWHQSGTGTVQLSNFKIVEGLPTVVVTKTPFEGERVKIDGDGNFSVRAVDRRVTPPVPVEPAVMEPFFPISLVAGANDAQQIGKRRVIAGINPLPTGLADVSQVAADTNTDNLAYYKGVGYAHLRASGFNTVKGALTSGGGALAEEAYANGFYSLMALPTRQFTTTDGVSQIPPAQQVRNPGAPYPTTLDPRYVTPNNLGRTPTSPFPFYTEYPLGILAWWDDWEDHAAYDDFVSWDTMVGTLRTAEDTTPPTGRKQHPIIVNSGVPGRFVAMKNGRADAWTTYAGNRHERTLQAQPLPLAGSGRFFRYTDAAPYIAESTQADVGRYRAFAWEAIANGAKMLHWYAYSLQKSDKNVCVIRDYAQYETDCTHADEATNASLWNSLAGLHAGIQGSLDFIRAPRAGWTPKLDSRTERRVGVVGKELNGQRYLLITNTTSVGSGASGWPFTFDGIAPRRLVPVVLGALQTSDASVPVVTSGSVLGNATFNIDVPADSARLYRVELPPQFRTTAGPTLRRP